MLCGGKLKRNGTTSAGRTRWRCVSCGASRTRERPDVTRKAQLTRFTIWLLGNATQQQMDSSARTFRRNHSWCWQVEPVLDVTGEIYDEIQVDGIYLRSDWCCLVATHRGKVVAWQWCDREKTVAWQALLEQFPPPTVVVCDGGSGVLAAVAASWPETRIQRCLVHVQRNVRTYLTTRPRTDAGKTLWGLARNLTRICDATQAVQWLQALNQWYGIYGHLTKERTYLNQLRKADGTPAWVRPGQRWWYTHDRLRRAYRLLAKLAERDHLFTYLAPELEALAIASTTNQIEGGVNAALRDLLRRHRGMTVEHQRRAIEWWLFTHAISAPNPATLIRTEHHQTTTTADPIEEPIGPAEYDTGLNAEEGLWLRRGWAGRS